jgi:hypothetical protein
LVEIEEIGHPVELAGGHAKDGIVEELFFHSPGNLIRESNFQKQIVGGMIFGREIERKG